MKKKKRKKLIGLVILALLWAVFLLVSKLETTNYFLGINLKLQNLFIAFEYQKLAAFLKIVTFLGNWQFIFPLTLLIIFLLWKYKKFKYIFPLLLSTAGAQICNSILKAILQKPRSFSSLISETSFSFPSGHAAISIAFYGILAYFAFIVVKKNSSRKVSFLIFLILILLVGFSRIYLRTHFYSDVLAGYFLGAVWLTLGILWFKSISFKIMPKTIIVIISVIILIASSLFYFSLPKVEQIKPPKVIITNNVILEFNNGTLPKFTEKLSRKRQQPLSFLILAKDDRELIDVFKKAGWFLADRITLKRSLIELLEVIENKPDPTATVHPSIWNNTVQNFSFSKPTAKNTIRQRHHGRVWKTNVKTVTGQTLYVVTASYDPRMKTFFSHKVDADIDAEREFLFKDLLKTGEIESYSKINFVAPTQGRNFQGDFFYTDGKAYLIYLK
ncbi:MAG: hypothetical protein A2W22_05700 [Candidatus Levybacteria bacterium RBG_16_35_11]|nr:MAG: hypothetical protein A2W22_05700 [Candidatus Levybacteria bacterium RBG_16_35_11]